MTELTASEIKSNIDKNGIRYTLRYLLRTLVENYYCSYTEIERGLNNKLSNKKNFYKSIERFIYEDKGNIKIEINGNIINHLILSLTNKAIYQSEEIRKVNRNRPDKYRTDQDIDKKSDKERRAYREKKRNDLKIDCNIDSILMAFGFLPISSQIIRVDCPARKQKILNLVDILDSGLINDDQFMSISEIIEDQVVILYKGINSEPPKDRNQIKNDWINKRLKQSLATEINKNLIKKEFQDSLESRDLKNKNNFTESEYKILYKSIVTKSLHRASIFSQEDYRLKVKNIDFKTKSIYIEKTLFRRISNTINTDQMLNARESLEQRIIKVEVEVKVSGQIISFQHSSISTYLGNLQSVMTRGMGSALQFTSAYFRVRALRESLESLVDCVSVISRPNPNITPPISQSIPSARIKDYQLRYWGQWVGKDTFLALAQSLAVALEDGIHEWILEKSQDFFPDDPHIKINDVISFYYVNFIHISKLRNSIKLQDFYEKPFSFGDIGKLRNLIEKTKERILIISKYIENNINYHELFKFMIASLYRIYGLAKFELFRLNFLRRGSSLFLETINIESTSYFKNELQKIFSNGFNKTINSQTNYLNLVINEWLIPIGWLYIAEGLISQLLIEEKISYSCDLSLTLEEIWEEYNFSSFLNLQPVESDINNKYYKYSTPDIYIAVSELLGRLGQIRYYLSFDITKQEKERLKYAGFYFSREVDIKKQLEQAERLLLLAAGYASRTGNPHRMAHWLILCYRVRSRLSQNIRQLKEDIDLLKKAKKLLSVDYRIPSLKLLRGAYLAEYYLASGEAKIFHFKHNRKQLIKAGSYLIQSVLSSVYLKLNLRLADTLSATAKAALFFSELDISVDDILNNLPDLDDHIFALNLTVPKKNLAQEKALECLYYFMSYENFLVVNDILEASEFQNSTNINSIDITKEYYESERTSWRRHFYRLNSSSSFIWNSWKSNLHSSNSDHIISQVLKDNNCRFNAHINDINLN